MSLLYMDDVGSKLVIQTSNTSLPATATYTLLLQKPGLSTVSINLTSGDIDFATGVVTYYTVAGDLDEVGEYKVQLHGQFTDADEYSEIDTFQVFSRLDAT